MEETMEQPTALTIAPRGPAAIEMGGRGIILRSFEDLQRFAKMVAESGTLPKGMTQAGAAVAIQAGLERGLSPLGGLQACIVINGVLSWRGWAAMALVRNSGHCKPGTLRVWTEGEGDSLVGKATAWRVGYEAPELITWTVKDAVKAGLWGKEGPWRSRPGNMLMWRAMGDLARFHWSDVLGGFPLQEEAEDFEELPRSTASGTRPDPLALTAPAEDPLLAGIDKPPEAQASPIINAAREPGEDDEPPRCAHPVVPPSRLALLKASATIVCPDCGEEFHGEQP
jgi:hypothetical protein